MAILIEKLQQRPGVKRPDAGPETRGRIVAAARTHFLAHGFRGVSMDDIAETLGMSKRTVYQHFTSKDDLVKAVILHKFNSIDAGLEAILRENEGDFPVALKELLAFMQTHTGEIQPAFMRDMHRESPEFMRLAEGCRREVIQRHFGSLLRTGRATGMIRRDIPVPVMIEFLLGAFEAVMNPSKKEQLGLTPKTGFAAIIKIFLEGVVMGKKEAQS